MSDTIDPKELKILSDILALVLEEHAGQSENALAAIRARAQKNQVTGGALKNLFAAIAPNPPKKAAAKPRAPRTTKASAAAAKEIQESHLRISQLTESIRRLDTEIRDLKVDNSALRAELNQTRQARAETQAVLSSVVQSRPPVRRSGLLVAAAVGALTGFALTETWHLFMSPSPAQASATYPPVHHQGQAYLPPPSLPLHSGSMPS
ncbi:hypothetical protein LU298_01020 [Komagataeibacter intermedius]|uniref:Uncharacterized protein n=2 Tax=Komagataeibacter intermedius TaxID=66229 RepID=A0A0N1N4U8_9PROT|nr:hypothetical protein [Komagataeibacter intermedius]KPH89019.1 hypothetical protein GLUCOINTEAF2_0200153 [Komagataeibacter intermedius AF2]MCF3635086.1 hypothetical protein [Komagataeibacter intermedius]GAN87607.1 hypothetical protein Gain_0074_038 [Komagataeibacter intermedius TF2]GBQ66101.1 hypothetical protein AA0521_0634 [Komagataeibacter intermedius NRIC 0521]